MSIMHNVCIKTLILLIYILPLRLGSKCKANILFINGGQIPLGASVERNT